MKLRVRVEATMGMNPVIARHLQEARRELVQQRDALNNDIKKIDDMLGADVAAPEGGTLEPAPATTATWQVPASYEAIKAVTQLRSALAHGDAGVGRGYPAIKDAILRFVAEKQHPVRTQDIAATLAEEYAWAPASVRSQVSRMARDGDLVGVRRGMYTVAADAFDDIFKSINDNAAVSAAQAADKVTTTALGALREQVDQGSDTEDAADSSPT